MSASIPFPGQHLADTSGASISAAEPSAVHAEVDGLLAQLSAVQGSGVAHDRLERDAQLLDRAHDVLVQALSTVDKT